MYCSKCGSKNDDDSRFCVECGDNLIKDTIKNVKQDKKGIRYRINNFNSRHGNIIKKFAIIIGLLIVLSIVGIVYLNIYSNGNEGNNEGSSVASADNNNNIEDTDASTAPTLVEIYISSIPKGANIYIGDEYKGISPKSIMLSEGRYRLKMNLTGYKGLITNFNVTSDMAKQEINVTFEPID